MKMGALCWLRLEDTAVAFSRHLDGEKPSYKTSNGVPHSTPSFLEPFLKKFDLRFPAVLSTNKSRTLSVILAGSLRFAVLWRPTCCWECSSPYYQSRRSDSKQYFYINRYQY